MRIREEPGRLTLDSASWWVSGGFAAAILLALFFGIGAIRGGEAEGWWLIFVAVFLSTFLLAFTERCQLVLDEGRAEMIYRRRTFRGHAETRRPLADLMRAEVHTQTSDGGGTHRMELIVGAERIPFRHVLRGGDSAKRAAEAVNAWLRARGVDTA